MEIEAFLGGVQADGRGGMQRGYVARHGVISFWRQLYGMAHYEGGGQRTHGERERERAAGRTMKGQLTSLCDA